VSRVLEKLIVAQVVNKFPASVHNNPPLVPILVRWIQSTPSSPISPRSILILSSHQCLRLLSGLFPSCFSTKLLYAFLFPSMRATCPCDYILFVSLHI